MRTTCSKCGKRRQSGRFEITDGTITIRNQCEELCRECAHSYGIQIRNVLMEETYHTWDLTFIDD